MRIKWQGAKNHLYLLRYLKESWDKNAAIHDKMQLISSGVLICLVEILPVWLVLKISRPCHPRGCVNKKYVADSFLNKGHVLQVSTGSDAFTAIFLPAICVHFSLCKLLYSKIPNT